MLDNGTSGTHNSNSTISDRNNEIDQEDDSSNNAEDSKCHFSVVLVAFTSFHEGKGSSQNKKDSTNKIDEQFLEK